MTLVTHTCIAATSSGSPDELFSVIEWTSMPSAAMLAVIIRQASAIEAMRDQRVSRVMRRGFVAMSVTSSASSIPGMTYLGPTSSDAGRRAYARPATITEAAGGSRFSPFWVAPRLELLLRRVVRVGHAYTPDPPGSVRPPIRSPASWSCPSIPIKDPHACHSFDAVRGSLRPDRVDARDRGQGAGADGRDARCLGSVPARGVPHAGPCRPLPLPYPEECGGGGQPYEVYLQALE